jgi:purine-nucleoside/S-methyl-5'-thioadenosine phosphorylase / adenosine deaminase
MPIERIEHTSQRLAWYQFTGEPLPSSKRFSHALVTRMGGVSQGPYAGLNLGGTVGDDPAVVQENHQRLFQALDIREHQVVSPHQVHGNNVARVGAQDGGNVIQGTDALITSARGLALLLRFADCVPVLFYDPAHHVAALAHAGWRGVAREVVLATVTALTQQFGTRPQDLWAGVGPAIGPRHYEVGADVVQAVRRTLPLGTEIARKHDQRWYLDLPGAVGAQLHSLGVGHVDLSGLHTASHTDEWYSHRAENGRTGRFGVLVMLR